MKVCWGAAGMRRPVKDKKWRKVRIRRQKKALTEVGDGWSSLPAFAPPSPSMASATASACSWSRWRRRWRRTTWRPPPLEVSRSQYTCSQGPLLLVSCPSLEQELWRSQAPCWLPWVSWGPPSPPLCLCSCSGSCSCTMLMISFVILSKHFHTLMLILMLLLSYSGVSGLGLGFLYIPGVVASQAHFTRRQDLFFWIAVLIDFGSSPGPGPWLCIGLLDSMSLISIPHICHGSHGNIRVNFFWPV